MTLHEAIKHVLIEANTPLSANVIAQYINQQKLYIRADNNPVPSSQVSARIKNYTKLFIQEGNLIKLFGLNELDILEEEIKSNLELLGDQFRLMQNSSNLNYLGFVLQGIIVLDSQKEINDFFYSKLAARPQFINHVNFIRERSDNLLKYLSIIGKALSHPSRSEIIRKITYWILKNSRYNEFLLPEYVSKIIGSLNLFDKVNYIMYSSNMLPTFFLDIYRNNPGSVFGKMIRTGAFNAEIGEVFSLMEQASKRDWNNYNGQPEFNQVSIFTPSWGLKNSDAKWASEFSEILDSLQQYSPPSKILILLPQSSLFFSGKYAAARKHLTDNSNLEAIVQIPYVSSATAIKSASLVLLNFQEKVNEVFIADYTSQSFDINQSWEMVAEDLNGKYIRKGYSKMVSSSLIQGTDHNWLPRAYLNERLTFESDDSGTVYTIKELLNNHKIGQRLTRDFIYPDGEVKVVRNADLGKTSRIINNAAILMGIDNDNLNPKPSFVNKGVLISLIGDHLKATELNLENEVLLGEHLALLNVNKNIVLPQFLVQELNKDYVLDQISVFRVGAVFSKISLTNVLKVKVKLPPILKQYELLNEFEQRTTIASEFDLSELDKEGSFNFISTIKHTLKQQLSPLSSDFKILIAYLSKQIESKKPINWDDILVPKFENDTDSDLSVHNLKNNTRRIQNYIYQSDLIIEKAEDLLKVSKMVNKKINLLKFFHDLKDENPDIQFEISKSINIIIGDEFQLKMAFQNMIDNARKHGFNETNKPWKIELHAYDVPDNEMLDIIFRNNGDPFDKDFDPDEYFVPGGKSGTKKGTGFGGYLISRVIENHKGRVYLMPREELEMDEFKVQINIELPKL